MKGLIRKELYVLNMYKSSVLMLLGFSVVFVFVMGTGSLYLPTMGLVMLMSTLLSAFTNDENSKWDRYAISMPVSRLKIVAARYIMFFGIVVGFMLLAFALDNGVALVKQTEVDLTTQLTSFGTVLLASLIIGAIVMPICYKFGAEKARYIVMVIYVIPFLLLVLFTHQFETFIAGLDANLLIMLPIIGAVLALVLYTLSCVLSSKIYAKKEF